MVLLVDFVIHIGVPNVFGAILLADFVDQKVTCGAQLSYY
jgi:hypothetical protein